jgi:hypothetical protein
MTAHYGHTTQPRTGTNGLAVAGLVCGIVGVFMLNFVLGPLAVIFGGIGLRDARRGAPRHNMAVAAVVLGIFDILLFVVLLVAAASGGITWHTG